MVSPNSGHGYENVTFGNSGKQINATSLNELLKNVISVEDGSSASSSNSTAPYFLENLNPDGTLSKTNADDVWKDIVQQENVDAIDHNHQPIHGQLGENILEEYFVRSGVFNQICVLNPQPLMAVDPTQDWLKYQMVQHQEQDVASMESDFPVSESMCKNQVVDIAFPNKQVINMAMPSPGESSESRVASEKKRRYSYEMDKTIERRQKRMIKNRESAARSRAKKQAHTILLEEEVAKLKKQNSLLKKHKAVDEMRWPADLEPRPKYQLRRTSSSEF